MDGRSHQLSRETHTGGMPARGWLRGRLEPKFWLPGPCPPSLDNLGILVCAPVWPEPEDGGCLLRWGHFCRIAGAKLPGRFTQASLCRALRPGMLISQMRSLRLEGALPAQLSR